YNSQGGDAGAERLQKSRILKKLLPDSALLFFPCTEQKKDQASRQPHLEKNRKASGSALLCSSPPAAPALWGRIALIFCGFLDFSPQIPAGFFPCQVRPCLLENSGSRLFYQLALRSSLRFYASEEAKSRMGKNHGK
ncbi:hypothetical protein SLEP1_g60218, partial [Rubroshorea leprosula]